jgi:hypothetical protein
MKTLLGVLELRLVDERGLGYIRLCPIQAWARFRLLLERRCVNENSLGFPILLA